MNLFYEYSFIWTLFEDDYEPEWVDWINFSEPKPNHISKDRPLPDWMAKIDIFFSENVLYNSFFRSYILETDETEDWDEEIARNPWSYDGLNYLEFRQLKDDLKTKANF